MKLLFDQNLSHRLCNRIQDLFPESTQVQLIELQTADDQIIWLYAKDHKYVIVTLDADFADIAALRGVPPKIIWLRCGNQRVATIENILRTHSAQINVFLQDSELACMELY